MDGTRRSFEWPPRSPDLTSLDYFLWRFLIDRIFRAGFPESLQEMEDRIMEHCLTINADMLARVRESFKERILICMHEEGKQFEQLM